MSNRKVLILLLMIICTVGNAESDSLDGSRSAEGFITIGIGGGQFGPTLYSGFMYVFNNHLLAIRYLKADEFQFNVEGNYDTPSLKNKEYGILYGRTFRKEFLELSLSAGVALLDGIDRGKLIQYREYERVKISTVGIPIEARFRFDFDVVSLGGAWSGNINRKRNFSAAVVQLSLKLFGY